MALQGLQELSLGEGHVTSPAEFPSRPAFRSESGWQDSKCLWHRVVPLGKEQRKPLARPTVIAKVLLLSDEVELG